MDFSFGLNPATLWKKTKRVASFLKNECIWNALNPSHEVTVHVMSVTAEFTPPVTIEGPILESGIVHGKVSKVLIDRGFDGWHCFLLSFTGALVSGVVVTTN